MLPMKSRKSSVPLNQINTLSNCNGDSNQCLPNPHLRDIGEEWLFLMFNILSQNYIFVLRIEKVLQGGISQAADPYIRAQSGSNLGRLGAKVQKIARSCCQRLGHYRMPFAWAARPIFKPLSDELDMNIEFGPLYRQEGNKLSDEDLLRLLFFDHIVGATCAISYPPKCEPTIEIQQFPTNVASSCNPYVTYTNHLYIFPKSLKYDSQKTFTKARNIVCTVEFRDGDGENVEPLKVIYGIPGESIYCTRASSSITHHNITLIFIKRLKCFFLLNCMRNIIYSLHSITSVVNSQKVPKDEMCLLPVLLVMLGYPFLTKDVSINLPPGYLSCKPLGLGKGFSGPEIRWVDGVVGFGLWDLTTCPVIPSLCHRPRPQSMPMILPVTSPQDDSLVAPGSEVGREVSKYVKTLHAVDMSTIIYFLPTLLNELFHLIVMTSNEDVALNTVRVLIHIVHGVHEAGKNDILHSYVQYVFKTQELTVKKRVVHEELTFMVLLPNHQQISCSTLIVNRERIKMLRQERFPADYQLCVRSLVDGIVPHILQKHKELPIETKQANISLAFFLKKCLSLMDRGFVFKLIKSYLEKFVPNDIKTLHEYKFEFLEIICFHEHFIALNLPIMRSMGVHGQTKNMKDFEHEYRLSDEFCRHHFLLGTLLQEIRASLCEVHDIRQTAISVFKNLLAKHAFDDRYQGKVHQARIASLYLPFISILIENYSSLHLKTPPATPPPIKKLEKVAIPK
ncbi:dedicator of cytokinesis protein 9 [Caerostris extrusa]|uniref:Dedicator of cytokinesis protein 9 n=1 Tax=Caerostris extrusa TaxID=172846 RepID=A0AAV4MS68_CAEEX|nr:dedicator of cytokinesis protein 9 [Caerostris extrusa]